MTRRLLVFALWAAALPSLSAEILFTLDPPDGALLGVPGQSLFWGLTIENDDSGWLVITSATYDQTVSIGAYADLLTPQFDPGSPAFQLWAVAPSATWSTPAMGSYEIDGSFAVPGDMAAGVWNLAFDIYGVDPEIYDPFTDPAPIPSQAPPLTATVEYVPEPVTIATTLIAVVALALGRRAAQRR